MPQVHVIAHYRTRPRAGDAVAATLLRHAASTRAEPGCVRFDVYRSADDPERFILVEQYSDVAAFEEHRRTRHFMDNIEGLVAPLLEEREWHRYEVLTSGGG